MKKIIIIVGTRPEAIKLFPVYRQLKLISKFNTMLLMTGQHNSGMMSPLLNFFEIRPNIELDIMVPNQSIAEFASSLLSSLDYQFAEHSPDLIVVQGDTTSCMVGSLAAFYKKIKIAHVEAGLRTFNRLSPYPEEVNRRITSLVADFHFAPTERARQNLLSENIEGHIKVVGNTVIDSLIEASKKISINYSRYKKRFSYLDGFDKIVLITGHRRENIGNNFREIYGAIHELAEKYQNFAFIYPVHINPLVRSVARQTLQGIVNIFLIEPLPYDEMVFLMRECYLVLTDSGGVQEECPTFSKPVLVLRDTTERPEGIEAGCSILAGVKKDLIIKTFIEIVSNKENYTRMSLAKNPYGDGNSSKRIVECVEELL